MCHVFSQGHLLTSANSQGADADHFNPDRFIGADGQVTPALAGTRDGASVIWGEILTSVDSVAFRSEGDRFSVPSMISGT